MAHTPSQQQTENVADVYTFNSGSVRHQCMNIAYNTLKRYTMYMIAYNGVQASVQY